MLSGFKPAPFKGALGGVAALAFQKQFFAFTPA
jgi:hypothetical protein